MAATGQDEFHRDFQPLTPGFVHARANDLSDVLEKAKAHKLAGIMIEVVQGEGGVITLEADFVKGIAALCQKEDIVLICDEVQIGNGRSGHLYGYMHYGITPDVFSTAKGLCAGLPLGATVLGEKVGKRPGLRRQRLHLRRQPHLLRRRHQHSEPDGRGAAGRSPGQVSVHRRNPHRRQGR